MKKLLVFIISLLLIFSACKNSTNTSTTANIDIDSLLRQNPLPTLAKFIYEHNNYILAKDFPPVVLADYVYENLNNLLIIDIRKKEAYEAGHIEGAYNVPRDSLLYYLEHKFNPAAYKNIILVCYTGQTATYAATLLHLLGYDNIYALKFGMAGWNKDFAAPFEKNISSKFVSKTDTTTNPIPTQTYNLPQLPQDLPIKVMKNRVEKLLQLPAKQFLISAEEVYNNLDKYYILDIRKPASYKLGHIPTAYNYPKGTLSYDQYLNTLPTNKPIAIYCYYGYTAVATVAYLRLLGYEAYSIKFGEHGFMDGVGGRPKFDFSASFKNYPYITGPERISKK